MVLPFWYRLIQVVPDTVQGGHKTVVVVVVVIELKRIFLSMNSYVTPTLCALNTWMQAIPTKVCCLCVAWSVCVLATPMRPAERAEPVKCHLECRLRWALGTVYQTVMHMGTAG